ncbi:hypothetical protein ACVME5_004039 [Bradyrhizobium liaoningense]
MVPEDLEQWQACDFLLGLDLTEGGGLLHVEADVETDADQEDRDQEGDAPAVSHEVALRQARHQREHADRGEIADGVADLHHAAEQAAAMRRAILDHHQHGAAPFAAEADTLEKAQSDQQHRRGNADLLVGRKQADQEGADAHHHDRDREHRLAADPVAVMAKDRSSERPRQKSDGVGAEGRDGGERGIACGEEDLVEHQRGRRAIDEEVVPFDRGADHARPHDPSQARRLVRRYVQGYVVCYGHRSLQKVPAPGKSSWCGRGAHRQPRR